MLIFREKISEVYGALAKPGMLNPEATKLYLDILKAARACSK